MSKIKEMVGSHFQCIFSFYPIFYSIMDSKYACYQVIPKKVSLVDMDRLKDILCEQGLLGAISSMKNGKSLDIDGFFVSFSRQCGILLVVIFATWSMKSSPLVP